MQAASSLNQSHVQLHEYISLKVHYKAVNTLAVRWADTRLYTNAHFHRDYYYKLRKLGGLQGTTTKSVRSILQFLKYFTGRLGMSESLYH